MQGVNCRCRRLSRNALLEAAAARDGRKHMSLCAIDFGNYSSQLWVEGPEKPERLLVIGLFADGLSESLAERLALRPGERDQLSDAYRRFREGGDDSAWRALVELRRDLHFPYSLRDAIGKLPKEEFPSPFGEDRGSMFFGECVSLHQWTLDPIYTPVERLKRLSGSDVLGRSFCYYEASEGITDPAGLGRDYTIIKTVLRHLVEGLKVEGAPLRAVFALPTNASAFTCALFCKLGRRAGFEAVVIRSEPELVVRHELGEEAPAFVLDIGAGTTELCILSPGSDGPVERQITLELGGLQIDAEVENILRERVAEGEKDSGREPVFERISREKLVFWKEACFSEDWERIRDDEFSFQDFQFPYQLGDKPTFRDVRPMLEAGLITEGLRRALESQVRVTAGELVRGLSPEVIQRALSQVIVTGGGSRVAGIEGLIRELLVEASGLPPERVRVTRVAADQDAVVAGAMSYASELSEDEWQQAARIQESWSEPVNVSEFTDWFEVWSEVMASEETRRQLHFDLNWQL